MNRVAFDFLNSKLLPYPLDVFFLLPCSCIKLIYPIHSERNSLTGAEARMKTAGTQKGVKLWAQYEDMEISGVPFDLSSLVNKNGLYGSEGEETLVGGGGVRGVWALIREIREKRVKVMPL